jgi:hypothetical protein
MKEEMEMASLDAVLDRFDASKAKVRREIREGFFDEAGGLRISEADLRAWIADRAVDELRVVFQLSAILAESANLIPAHILVRLTEQLADESRHFDVLRRVAGEDMTATVDAKVAALPDALASDPHWTSLMAAVRDGNPYAALLDINIVHEGYSAAAIEELANIPYSDVRDAYASIGADEEKHHESGRELLSWLAGASQLDSGLLGIAADRAGGSAMSWSWPAATESDTAGDVIGRAHERAGNGNAMSWSWPAPVDTPTA